MALSEILTKIKEVQPFAEEVIESGPPETARARQGRKSQSIESLKRYRRRYASELLRTAAFIVVVGDQRDEFVKIALESRCFSANPEKFYEDLVNRIPQTLYLGRESVSNTFDILGRHLEDKMIELDAISGYPQVVFRQEYQRTVHSKEEFLNLVKEALVAQVGGEIVGIQAVHDLTDEAIARGHAAKFTPILLPANESKFALTVAKDLERVSQRVFVVVAGNFSEGVDPETYHDFPVLEVNEATVKKTLKSISTTLKNSK